MKKWFISLVLYITLGTLCQAHEWYPLDCCSGNDCRPVDCKELISQPDGTVKYKDMTFRRDQKRASQDGYCHACYSDKYNVPYCVFFPAGS